MNRQKLRVLSDNIRVDKSTLQRKLRIYTAVTVSVYYYGMSFICNEFVRDVKEKQGVCAASIDDGLRRTARRIAQEARGRRRLRRANVTF